MPFGRKTICPLNIFASSPSRRIWDHNVTIIKAFDEPATTRPHPFSLGFFKACLSTVWSNQCVQIGRFLIFLADIFLQKWIKYLVTFCCFEKHHFSIIKTPTTFWATLEKLGYFLPQHLVTLEATLSHFLFIAFSYKGSHFSTHITSICTTMWSLPLSNSFTVSHSVAIPHKILFISLILFLSHLFTLSLILLLCLFLSHSFNPRSHWAILRCNLLLFR